ncbi:MAG: hypothetical protein K2Q18_16795 [Bdellovibrionales bacterium]|nr:hypothetical protein [Bdellovibrionales bacterium]
MKVKTLIAAALMTVSLSSFAVDITLSPIYTVVDVVRSVLGSTVGIVASPFASTAASSQQREQLEAIKGDAQDFIADGTMTERLSKTIESLKADKELAGKSPEELAVAIVRAVN